MKKGLFAFIALLGLLGLSPAYGADAPKKTPTAAQAAQQNRMKNCAKQYHEQNIPKSGYRAFMKECLSTHKKAAPKAVAPAPAKPAKPPKQSATPVIPPPSAGIVITK